MANKSQGEALVHCGSTRLRVLGEGVLDLQLESLNTVDAQELVGMQMATATQYFITRLANFQSMRVKLRGSVDEIDEWFSISLIVLYTKPVATSIPSVYDGIPTT